MVSTFRQDTEPSGAHSRAEAILALSSPFAAVSPVLPDLACHPMPTTSASWAVVRWSAQRIRAPGGRPSHAAAQRARSRLPEGVGGCVGLGAARKQDQGIYAIAKLDGWHVEQDTHEVMATALIAVKISPRHPAHASVIGMISGPPYALAGSAANCTVRVRHSGMVWNSLVPGTYLASR